MNEQLKQFATEAVQRSAQLEASNEAKKRTAFAYINEKILENKIENISLEDIDKAIEEVWEATMK